MKKQHTPIKSEVEGRLRNWLSDARRVVIAAIGNPLRKDDFVGVQIVRNLQRKVSRSVYLIECETVPESFIGPITEFKPTHVLIIDAALLNLKPGSLKLMEPAQLAVRTAISTHALPLKIFCEYLARTTGAKVALLMIQPGDTGFGEGLTARVEETAEHLTNLLSKILP
jgi:hydrogenase 3 maturation protease